MTYKKAWLLAVLIGLCMAAQPNCGLARSRFTQFQIAKSYTQIAGLNDSGTTTGSFGNSAAHGFLRTSDGTVTTFDVPGAVDTVGTCINSAGVIAGMFGGKTPWQPFVRNTDGTITTYDILGAYPTAAPTAINDSGTVVGWYDSKGSNHGFIIAANGTVTDFDVPGAANTALYGINASGYIVGTYNQSGSSVQGFVLAPDGTITTVSVPNANGTFVSSINDNGVVAGWYINSCCRVGFVEATDGTITTISCPDSGAECEVLGINDVQQITGWSYLGNNQFVGFVQSSDGTTKILQPKKGTAISFSSSRINSNGWVAGSFETMPRKRVKGYGFVWTP